MAEAYPVNPIRHEWLYHMAREFQLLAIEPVFARKLALSQVASVFPPTTRLEALVIRGFIAESCDHDNVREHFSASDKLAHEIREFIDLYYAQRISVMRLALHFGSPPATIERAFRRAHGLSIHTYLTNVRVGHAIDAVQSTEIKFEGIARDVGFKSKKDLYRHIREATGRTPQELRSSADDPRKPRES